MMSECRGSLLQHLRLGTRRSLLWSADSSLIISLYFSNSNGWSNGVAGEPEKNGSPTLPHSVTHKKKIHISAGEPKVEARLLSQVKSDWLALNQTMHIQIHSTTPTSIVFIVLCHDENRAGEPKVEARLLSQVKSDAQKVPLLPPSCYVLRYGTFESHTAHCHALQPASILENAKIYHHTSSH